MHKSRFLTATTIAMAVAALGATLSVDKAAAQSRRGVFAHQYQGQIDRDGQQDQRDNKREIIDFVNRATSNLCRRR